VSKAIWNKLCKACEGTGITGGLIKEHNGHFYLVQKGEKEVAWTDWLNSPP
jgi:hypothetical protein